MGYLANEITSTVSVDYKVWKVDRSMGLIMADECEVDGIADDRARPWGGGRYWPELLLKMPAKEAKL